MTTRQPSQPQRPPGLPNDYLNGGYFDEEGHLRVQVVGDWARQVARALIGPNPQRPLMASNQLRNFYTKVRIAERKLDAGQSFAALRAEISSLERDAATAVGRQNAPEVFKEFIDKNMPLVLVKEEAFRQGFLEHFQSIVGFHKYEEWRGGQSRPRR